LEHTVQTLLLIGQAGFLEATSHSFDKRVSDEGKKCFTTSTPGDSRKTKNEFDLWPLGRNGWAEHGPQRQQARTRTAIAG